MTKSTVPSVFTCAPQSRMALATRIRRARILACVIVLIAYVLIETVTIVSIICKLHFYWLRRVSSERCEYLHRQEKWFAQENALTSKNTDTANFSVQERWYNNKFDVASRPDNLPVPVTLRFADFDSYLSYYLDLAPQTLRHQVVNFLVIFSMLIRHASLFMVFCWISLIKRYETPSFQFEFASICSCLLIAAPMMSTALISPLTCASPQHSSLAVVLFQDRWFDRVQWASVVLYVLASVLFTYTLVVVSRKQKQDRKTDLCNNVADPLMEKPKDVSSV